MESEMAKLRGFAWLFLLVLISICIQAYASTTEAPDSNESEENKRVSGDGHKFLEDFPQSALSMLGLGIFIVLSMAVAYFMEKLYERMSIRDDTSDMSETTKNILKQAVLGMVFGKKDDISKLKGKEREKALMNKYGRKWLFNSIMRKQRKKRESLQKTPNAKHLAKRGSFFIMNGPSSVSASVPETISEEPTLKATPASTVNSDDVKKVPEPEVTPSADKPLTKNSDVNKTSGSEKTKLPSQVKTLFSMHTDLSPVQKAVPPVKKDHPTITKQKTAPVPQQTPQMSRSLTKTDFHTVDFTFAPEVEEAAVTHEQANDLTPNKENNKDDTALVSLSTTSFDDDEFAIDIDPIQNSHATITNSNLNKFKSGSKNDLLSIGKESDISQKYVAPETPKQPSFAQKAKTIRPLTAGKSKQIAPGGAQRTTNSTDNYKQQGNSVRSEVMKKLRSQTKR